MRKALLYYSFIRKAKKHKLLFIELGERAAPEFGKFNARYVIEHITHRVDGPARKQVRVRKFCAAGKIVHARRYDKMRSAADNIKQFTIDIETITL